MAAKKSRWEPKKFFGEDISKGAIVPVKVSAKNARLLFEGCSKGFIQNTCKGACCHIKSLPEGTILKVEPEQQPPLVALGALFTPNGIMKTVDRRCIFHDADKGFCGLHFTENKPNNCIQSPFMLNSNDTLIVRNRYKMLVCYRAPGAVPAYEAFRSSFDILFGKVEAERIVAHLRAGGGDIIGNMIKDRYLFNKSVAKTWHDGTFNREKFLVETGVMETELTPITFERSGRGLIYFKRDDMFQWAGAWGGKARSCRAILPEAVEGIVSGGSRVSFQATVVADIAKFKEVSCRFHAPSGEIKEGPLMEAKARGVEIVQHKPGYSSVVFARARVDALERGWFFVPPGLALHTTAAATSTQVKKIPKGVKRFVVPVGSGMTLSGVLQGLQRLKKKYEVLGVQVGADPSKRLDEFAPEGWRGMCEIVKPKDSFKTKAENDRGFNPYYEGKCLSFLKAGDLLWVVGA